MTPENDAKIIDLIKASAKEGLSSEGNASQFQSLEFFPPRTDQVFLQLKVNPYAISLCVIALQLRRSRTTT